MKEIFDTFLIVMAALALVVFVALHFFAAGYGYLFDRLLSEEDFDEAGNLKGEANGKPGMPVMSMANPRPGEALFKDVKADGVIDGQDKSYFGYSDRDEYV